MRQVCADTTSKYWRSSHTQSPVQQFRYHQAILPRFTLAAFTNTAKGARCVQFAVGSTFAAFMWTVGLLKKPQFSQDMVIPQQPIWIMLLAARARPRHILALFALLLVCCYCLQAKNISPLAGVHTLGNLLTNVSLGKVAVSFTHTIKVSVAA